MQARLGCNSELILDEFGEKLLEELDYQQEARNIEVGGPSHRMMDSSADHSASMHGAISECRSLRSACSERFHEVEHGCKAGNPRGEELTALPDP
jgi:hypothetical protein